jgi:transcriptional regulator with XRE-family HTH domain
MARRPGAHITHGKTKLARLRAARDVSLEYAAEWIGISPTMLWRLEHAKIRDPRLPWLVNAALFYAVSLEEVIEGDWLKWSRENSQYDDDIFSRYWGEQTSDQPPPLRRRQGSAISLVRPKRPRGS